MTAQHIINNLEFARKSHELHGTILDSQLPRLAEVLVSTGNQLDWQLKGIVTEGGILMLELKASGALSLSCQRCLGDMGYALDIDTNYVLVPDESAIPSDEDNLDDQEYLIIDESMNVVDLLEDEILLALPLAPKHDVADCDLAGKVYESGKLSPFEALKALKVNKS